MMIRWLCYSKATQHIITSSWDKSFKVFSRDSKELKSVEGHAKRINGIDVSADGTKIATGSN